jgi:hypothetical protein
MFNHHELIDFAYLRFSGNGVTRPMLEAYFSTWAYNAVGAKTMSELLGTTDAEEIVDWWSQRNAEPLASAGSRQSGMAVDRTIDGKSFAGLMKNISKSGASAIPVRVKAPESAQHISSAPDNMTLVDALGDKYNYQDITANYDGSASSFEEQE